MNLTFYYGSRFDRPAGEVLEEQVLGGLDQVERAHVIGWWVKSDLIVIWFTKFHYIIGRKFLCVAPEIVFEDWDFHHYFGPEEEE